MTSRRHTDSSSAAYFEAKYQDNPDPWNFANSDYEQARYAATIAALQGRQFRRAFEPGCSVGVLTEKLLTVADQVEAIDFAASAIETARRRCASLNATFRVMNLPDRLPVVGFDLIVLSEIGYYFQPEQWSALVSSMVHTSAPGTIFLATHWLGTSPDHAMSGDQVHSILRADPNLNLLHEERHPGFRLDLWERLRCSNTMVPPVT